MLDDSSTCDDIVDSYASLDELSEPLSTIIASRGIFRIICVTFWIVTSFLPDRSNRSKIILSKVSVPPRQMHSTNRNSHKTKKGLTSVENELFE